MVLARAAHRRVDLSVHWQAEMDRGTHNAVVKLQSIRCPWPSCCPSKEKEQQEPHRCVRQGVSAPCCWSMCSGRQETLLRGQELLTGGRSRSTRAGVGAGDPGLRQEPMRRVAGRCAGRLEPLHCSWVRAQGIRRWSARPPFDTQRLEDIAVDPCMRGSDADVAVDRRGGGPREGATHIIACGRRHCAVRQKTLRRVAGDTAAGGKSRCAGCRTHGRGRCCGQGTQPPRAERQAAEATTMGGRTLRRAAGAAAPDGKRLCARRQELRSVGRQYTLRCAAGDTVANGKRPCSGPQEPPLRGATGDCALCGRSCAVRQGSKSRCGRRQDVAAGGRSCRTGGRSRTTGAGSVASASRQETLLGWSVTVPGGSRFCRWQEPLHRNGMSHCTGWQEPLRRAAGAQAPGGKSRRSARRKETLRRAAAAPGAGDTAAGVRNCCAGRQETLRQQQSPCAGDRSRCTGPQKTLLLAAGAAAPGVRSRRAGQQDTRLETLLQAAGAACGRQDPL